ncbi:hypothetical protein EBU71_19935, partial [bacterium]|nr:hypothetical protein [Candidatus Elulimicrobium humile]
MKFNQLTCQISLGVLAITALYTLVYSGLTGVLLSAAIGLIAAAFIDEFELVSAITIIFALLYTLFLKRFLMRLEPFMNEDDPKHIAGRLAQMKKDYRQAPQDLKNPRLEPAGVYDPSIEGFADVPSNNQDNKQEKKEGAPTESSSAPNKPTNQVDPNLVNSTTNAITKNTKDEQISTDEFQSATNALFKLGKLPSEHSDGPRLDPGKTLEKAMSALDPSTISSMTTDTKQLIETQKGLMSMLNQMRPVLADGKELL